MIRLVLGLVLLFLGLSMATALVVQAVRKKRAAKRLAKPFATRTHAGTESTYWQTKCAPDSTKAITRTSGRLPDPLPSGPVKSGVYTDIKDWTVDYTRPKAVSVNFDAMEPIAFDFSAAPWLSDVRNEVDYFGATKPVEEWAPKHPLPGWRVVKVDATHYAVSSKCPADVQRYSPSMLGWVKEEDLGAWGEAVWASIQLPPLGHA